MKIVICYFSGTGNTRKVAECFAQNLTDKGHEVQTVSVDGVTLQKKLPDELTKAIIGYRLPRVRVQRAAHNAGFCAQIAAFA